MAAEIALCVAPAVGGCLEAPVCRHCGYIFFSDRYLRELIDEVRKLDARRHDVQQLIDLARNNMKPITRELETWVDKVYDTTNKASNVLDYDGKTCFYGWLPNPKARHRLGRDARKTVLDIQELLKQKFERFYNESAPSGLVGGTPNVNLSAGDRDDIITDSRASIFEGIMKALNDGKHKVIGVYGPGGVGKTTMLKEVKKKLNEKGGPFHMIVYVEVSQTPDFNNIQAQIVDAMCLDLKDKQSRQGRRDFLLERLRMKPEEKVLIIVDDLWDILDLEKEVGIPLGDESMKCKLLLTSRNKSVLDKMRATETFLLECLSYDEAFSLFEKEVGDMLKDEESKAKAAQVVRKLNGLPLLITSVAGTLKCSDVSAWDNMLIEDENIERIVKWSYDHLKSEKAKSLFLLCGLIGGTIEVELLLGLGMGLGLFEEFNNRVQESRNRLNTMLHSLRSIGLLQDGGDGKENVTIHDLYSEAVVSTPFAGQNYLKMNNIYGSWSMEKLEKCEAISLADVGRDSLVEIMACQLPDLKILMLSLPRNWHSMPKHQHDMGDCLGLLDFKYMEELRVLYLRSMHITSLPSSIGILGNLRSLYLSDCDVEDVAILGKLKALQILSFEGSVISRLPKEIGELKNLRLLNLSYCYGLEKVEPGALKGLIKLEELYMMSFNRWMGEDEIPSESSNAKLSELKSLTKLTALEISIPDPTVLLKDGDLPFGNLIRFWINIGNVEGREFKGLKTMKLKLEGCDSILSREWVQKILQKTQYLYLEGLRESKNNVHELCTQGFGQLKHLDIVDSPSIKYIVNSSKGIPLTTFTILESLFLRDLINLEKICHGPIAPECFSKLKDVRVEKCDQLKNLWFLSEIQRLEQLEELEVRECQSMRAIVIDGEGKDISATDNGVELPNVRWLKLFELPKMTSFCAGAGITSEGAPIQVSLPRLESLEMDGVLGLEKIRDNMVFRNLKELSVGNMGLTFLFPVSMAKCLREIRSITVEHCPNMKSLILDEEGRDEGTNDIIEFPLLEKLSICECPMEKFFSCPNAKKESVTTTSNSQDAYSDSFFDRKVSLPSLVILGLREVGCLKRIWHGELPRSSFCKLAALELRNCFDLLHVFPSTIIGRLYNLKEVEIRDCTSLESLFDCGSLDANTEQTRVLLPELVGVNVNRRNSLESSFDCGSLESNTERKFVSLPKLSNVRVSGAGRLRHVVKSTSKMVLGFPNLKNVQAANCSDLKYLFHNYTATTLEKLETLYISNCEQMKEVVLKEEGGRSKAEVMSFPCLRYLSIWQCPNLRSFIRSPTSVKRQLGKTAKENDEALQPLFNEMVTFPDITTLSIEGVRCKELWNNDIPIDSFCQLKSLELSHCDNLRRIAPSHMWKRLQYSLEILQMGSCHSIEIIYEGDGTVTKNGKLETLVLRDLANLRHIWQSDGLPNVPFPNLRCVEAARCSGLKMLFATFTEEFLGQIEELEVESCENMELIAGDEECEEAIGRKITFSNLTVLRLFELPKFRSFLPEKYSLKFPYSEDFPSLGDLSIVSCGTEEDRGIIVDWESHQERRQLEMVFRNYETVLRVVP